MEDEEHVIFECPEYKICRLKYPEIFNLMEKNLRYLLHIDNQESISNLLWDIRNICNNSGISHLLTSIDIEQFFFSSSFLLRSLLGA